MPVSTRRTLAAMSLTALVTIGCDAPTQVPVEESVGTTDQEPVEEHVPDPGEADDEPHLINECHNDVHGYQIRFPEGWYTNDGTITAACHVFAIDPPEIEPATEFPLDVAVLLDVIDRPFEEAEEMVATDPSVDVDNIEHTTIGGREALRVDGTSTGEGLLDAGVDLHHTYVAFDGRTVLASAYELGHPGLEERRRIIALMLETLTDDRPRAS